MRYLSAHGTAGERAAYLEARDGWETGPGHPWPLIEWYRAVLLLRADDRAGASERLQRGVDLALDPEQGLTVHFIGLVLGLAGELLGLEPTWRGTDPVKLRQTLPRAPWAAVDAARERRWTGGAAAFVARCLPFNFR